MTKIEQIKDEIESRINFHKSLASAEHVYQNDYAVRELKDLLSFIESLEEEHPIDGLDDAAFEYSAGSPFRNTEEAAFKAGAEWMAGQGVILNLSIDELSCGAYNSCVEQGLTSEDNVIIQIRKKQ